MSLYELLVIVHVLAAALWIGGGVMMTLLAGRAWASRDDERVVELSRMGDFVGTRMFAPATLLLLGAGVWAVAEGSWDWGDAWVSIGFAGWLAGVLIAMAWHNTEGRRIRDAVGDGGAAGPRARRVATIGMAVGLFEIAVLVVVVWAMVAKPGI
ncbi:DUF2269 family protein [Miltoncostaea marina]|uniref:DUF2269 family protein n=1 Tax=Miltoncostaea marina TaxID=2843215 RepID=UPI001C3C37B9|nr:DUF2269 family protein [Miltoncostaea marina]